MNLEYENSLLIIFFNPIHISMKTEQRNTDNTCELFLGSSVFFVHSAACVIKINMQPFLRYSFMDKLQFYRVLGLRQETANLTSDVVMCAKTVPLMEWGVRW